MQAAAARRVLVAFRGVLFDDATPMMRQIQTKFHSTVSCSVLLLLMCKYSLFSTSGIVSGLKIVSDMLTACSWSGTALLADE